MERNTPYTYIYIYVCKIHRQHGFFFYFTRTKYTLPVVDFNLVRYSLFVTIRRTFLTPITRYVRIERENSLSFSIKVQRDQNILEPRKIILVTINDVQTLRIERVISFLFSIFNLNVYNFVQTIG